MESWIHILVTVVTSILGSSGIWVYVQKKADKNDLKSIMLIGLAHDRIVYLGMKYIDRGWITNDEFENLHDYLYTPYVKMGGNGSAARVMKEVEKLPIKNLKVLLKTGGKIDE